MIPAKKPAHIPEVVRRDGSDFKIRLISLRSPSAAVLSHVLQSGTIKAVLPSFCSAPEAGTTSDPTRSTINVDTSRVLAARLVMLASRALPGLLARMQANLRAVMVACSKCSPASGRHQFGARLPCRHLGALRMAGAGAE